MTDLKDQVMNQMEECARRGMLTPTEATEGMRQAEAAHLHRLQMLQPGDDTPADHGPLPGPLPQRGITHRDPKAIDADRNGNVQVLTFEGWQLARLDDVETISNLGFHLGWQHTPGWKLRDRGNELLDKLVVLIGSRQPITFEMQELLREMRGALTGET